MLNKTVTSVIVISLWCDQLILLFTLATNNLKILNVRSNKTVLKLIEAENVSTANWILDVLQMCQQNE